MTERLKPADLKGERAVLLYGRKFSQFLCQPLDSRSKPNLISATICRDTIGSEAALQLSMPVWQCDAESLNQAGVRKNRIGRALRGGSKFFRGNRDNISCNQRAFLGSHSEPLWSV